MKNATIGPALALAVLLAAGSARAQAVSLIHLASIYEDDKDRPLKEPEGVACDDRGRVVVADTGNGRLLTLTFANRRVSGGAEVRLAQLPRPAAVQLDAKGNLLVLDRKVRKIARVDAGGQFLGYLEVKGVASPSAVVPGAFKVDAAGSLVVLDLAAEKVLVLDPGGTVVRQLDLPRGGTLFADLAVDPAGTLYALDAVGSSIWVADRSATAFKPLVQGMKEIVHFPTHLVPSRGRLFVTDQNGHGIAVFGIDGSYQGRLLGMGWTDGLVYYPSQLCISGTEELFLADRYNSRVQAFSMTVK
ncbi:MAG TPA: NHL repeat-containing protein [Anaeromyxobacteraceae bacterium]|nr:NHL repeat-containing protein [Anaeromyxobacteraceae bacterium]